MARQLANWLRFVVLTRADRLRSVTDDKLHLAKRSQLSLDNQAEAIVAVSMTRPCCNPNRTPPGLFPTLHLLHWAPKNGPINGNIQLAVLAAPFSSLTDEDE
jgi:hypothetical protein